MTPNWSRLKHFKKTEAWGEPDKMDMRLLQALDDFRGQIPFLIKIMNGYATAGHSPKSYHYQGMATDCRLIHPETRKVADIQTHILYALKSPFSGIGIYTWGANGPFLHFDVRPLIGQRVVWVSESQNQYKPLTIEFMHRMFGKWAPLSS